MTTGATGQLGLALPVQGELSGTWGDTVNNGITQYTNIAIAGTLTLTGDGAVTLANTTGDASASNITSTLAGAGTVTAQFAVVRVSGTTTTKVVTGPSYSKTYLVDNASSFAVTFKASGQTGVSVAAAEKVSVYFNGTDYVKIAGTIANAAGSNTQIQFNNGGLFGASSSLTWDGTTLSSTQVNITGQGTLRLQDTTGGEYVALRAPATLGANYTLTFPADDGTSGQALITDGSGVLSWSTAASGDVYGPASATANGIALFDGTTGKIIKDSAAQDGLIYGLTVGRGAGAVATNTAVGYQALIINSTGSNNTAVGYQTGTKNTTGSSNTAVGVSVMDQGAGVTGDSNIGIGNYSLRPVTSGTRNIGIGVYALSSNTTGSYNVGTGTIALASSTTGSSNTAIGDSALYNNTTASNNTAVGYQAGYTNTTGTMTAMGYRALYFNSTGGNNTAVGYEAMYGNSTGGNNTAYGYNALYTNGTGGNNTAIGLQALVSNSTGNNNTALGVAALNSTTGSNNVAVGYQAGYTNTSGLYMTAVGYQAAHLNTTGEVAAVGYQAAFSNTTGTANTAFGRYRPLYANTTGNNNTAIGDQALQANTTASNNTAVGYQAGYTNQTGTGNALFGYQAGFNATGSRNTFIGTVAGYSVTTGAGNVFIGNSGSNNSAGSGYYMTSGDNNIIIGGFLGNQDGLDIRTSSAYAVISDGLGRRQLSMYEGGTVALDSAVPVAGTGITFPASQSASSDANTLDDYEEGTWTPSQGTGLTVVGTFSSSGKYTKIGNLVTVNFRLDGTTSVACSSTGQLTANLPFSVAASPGNAMGSCMNSGNVFTGAYAFTTEVYAGTTALAASGAILATVTYQV